MAEHGSGVPRDGDGFRLLVASAPGLESLCAEELRSLGLAPSAEDSGVVAVTGGWDAAARILIRSRIASRVAVSLRRFSSRNRAMLYDQVRRIDWPGVFSPDKTLAVRSTGTTRGTDFALSYAPLRIKDAICDEFRKRGHPRPDVDRHAPQALVNAFFFQTRCELSLDLTGAPLHRRGYRPDGAAAPLRENRAAALLRFAGYDGSRPFVDPFCGSGTLPIEAALIATRTAPGLLRDASAFALGSLFPEAAAALDAERAEAEGDRLDAPPHPVTGRDTDGEALDTARANARRAGAAAWVRFETGDAREIAAPDAWIVTNPPYGERLTDPEAAAALLRAFIHQVKHACTGSRLGMVLPRGRLEKAVGLRPEKRLAVESGSLGLRYLAFEIRAGKFT
jgi:putative N6-adenine-specific DNA methylase